MKDYTLTQFVTTGGDQAWEIEFAIEVGNGIPLELQGRTYRLELVSTLVEYYNRNLKVLESIQIEDKRANFVPKSLEEKPLHKFELMSAPEGTCIEGNIWVDIDNIEYLKLKDRPDPEHELDRALFIKEFEAAQAASPKSLDKGEQ